MRQNILICFLFLFAAGTSCKKDDPVPEDTGQNAPGYLWKYYGSATDMEEAYCVIETPDSNFLLAGADSLRKIDPSGNVIWSNDLKAVYIQPVLTGGYILTGGEAGTYTKIDESGAVIWEKSITGNLNCITETSDQGFIGIGTASDQIHLIKTDASGLITWSKTLYAGSLSSQGYEVHESNDGGFVLIGTATAQYGLDTQVIVYKMDASGNTLWSKNFGLPESPEWGRSLKPTLDGGCIIAGTSGFNEKDMWVQKLSNEGVVEWTETYGGTEADVAYFINQASDGGFILTGSTCSFGEGTPNSTGQGNVWLVKIDSSGNMIWDKTFGGDNGDWGNCVAEASDGEFVLAGATDYKLPGSAKVCFIKTP